jgi:hypothetical protein
VAQANLKEQPQKMERRSKVQIEQEMYTLSLLALAFIVPGIVLVFVLPPLGVILMVIGGFIWIQKDTHYTNELQRNGYLPDKP